MRFIRFAMLLALGLRLPLAQAEAPAVVRDLEPLSPATLSKEELKTLLTDAKMHRVAGSGNDHYWTNEADGKFVISTTNRDKGGTPTTARGTWQISDDGRYCVLIEWRRNPTEEWCRFVIKTSDGYYATKSAETGTEKVYKLEVLK
jgi:hypothetical protein